jgi:CubicO group peptidase (beta-lactamase class C family)
MLATASLAADYFPTRGNWEQRSPAQAGMDASRLQAAIDFAIASEATDPRDLGLRHEMTFGREPHGKGVGPFRTRAAATGVIIRNGYLVAEWGDPARVDMTYSVSKSFLSTTVGLAVADGLIRDVHDRVGPYMAPVTLPAGDGERGLHQGDYSHEPVTLFEDEHNRKITWDHLLRQTSAWRGTLWGKPDWADRPADDRSTWYDTERAEPGTAYEYNDTRVNLLALAATQVWRRPLPVVLRERIMDPIGASPTWRWHGYENSWIVLDGQQIQSVSGGGHWGGGMQISAYDQARFGLFTLHRGEWAGERLLPDDWFEMALTPTPARQSYGFMNFYLHRTDTEGRRSMPSTPENSFRHVGSGSNIVYVDPTNDLVVVTRWIQGSALNEFLGKVIAAIE